MKSWSRMENETQVMIMLSDRNKGKSLGAEEEVIKAGEKF